METLIPLFVGTFTTLLAVINPLEAMPVFLQLLQGQAEAHHRVAYKSCLYATLLDVFLPDFRHPDHADLWGAA